MTSPALLPRQRQSSRELAGPRPAPVLPSRASTLTWNKVGPQGPPGPQGRGLTGETDLVSEQAAVPAPD